MAPPGFDSATCAICNEPAPKRCKGCKSSYYCSVTCQQTDWPVHKYICKLFAAADERPSPDFKRAIFFDPKADSPRLVWVECYVPDPLMEQYHQPELDLYLGENYVPGSTKLQHSMHRERNLNCTLEIYHRDSFLDDGLVTNRAVLKITNGTMAYDWRGPLVAMRRKGLGSDPPFFGDIRAIDFRDVVDHFLKYGKAQPSGPFSSSAQVSNESPNASKVKGVRIACEGEVSMKTNKYASVAVPSDHQIWIKGSVPRISQLVGLPVRAWK